MSLKKMESAEVFDASLTRDRQHCLMESEHSEFSEYYSYNSRYLSKPELLELIADLQELADKMKEA